VADTAPTPRRKKIIDTDVLVMGGVTILLAVLAFTKGKDLPLQGLQTGLGLLREMWLPLVFGFCLAGMIGVVVPRELLIKWMGEESGTQGILIGWLVGLLLPGGPYVVFPLTASLLRGGIGVGPLLTFITAKLLLSPVRLFTWEIPFLGWAFVTARTVPSLFLPPIVGLIGQRLYALFPKL